jgi:hypothetical protein
MNPLTIVLTVWLWSLLALMALFASVLPGPDGKSFLDRLEEAIRRRRARIIDRRSRRL